MNIRTLANSDLISSTEKAVAEERKATMVLLHHLREIERRRLYSKFGFSSLFAMVTQKFGYSEASAQRRINAMRLIRDVPEVEAKIASGELSLTSAASVQSFFREKRTMPANEKNEVISSCLNKSSRNVEKELASRNPEKDKRQDFRYTKSDRLRMSMNISEDLYAKFETAKYYGAFKTIEDMLHLVLDNYIAGVEAQPDSTPAPELKSAPIVSSSRYISKITKQIVATRNPEQRCEYEDPITHKRCERTEGLQFDHHFIPFSKGGPSITANLRQLCGPHNRFTWHNEQK